jgi:anti-sigma B factor antagonist
MEVQVSRHQGYVLCRTTGPLDESTRDAFREELHPLVANAGTCLILDLAGSQRINSQGVGSLVALVADANTHDSRVILCNLQSFVAVVITVTKLDKYFDIVAKLDDAIARAKGPRSGLPGKT